MHKHAWDYFQLKLSHVHLRGLDIRDTHTNTNSIIKKKS